MKLPAIERMFALAVRDVVHSGAVACLDLAKRLELRDAEAWRDDALRLELMGLKLEVVVHELDELVEARS